MIDITYCYLEDTMGDDWEKKYSPSEFKDPDRYSKRLHEDLLYIWGTLPHESERYSPDFIGANRTQAHYIGLDKEEIAKYLKTQRTIGGHMLFPVLPHLSINQARGCNMLDRFDFTLAELREYFLYLYIEEKDKPPYKGNYSIQLENSFAENRAWLEYFCKGKNSGIEAFKAFIDYFYLDEFVDCKEKYEVFSLACSDLCNGAKKTIGEEAYFPGFPEDYKRVVHVPTIKKRFEAMEQSEKKEVQAAYRRYIQNTSYVIEQRNIAIKNKQKDSR